MLVTVPGSSSNFGPGFDCLGLAWKLYDRISFEAADRLIITGCEERFRGPENLAYRSFAAAFSEKGLPVPGVRIDFGECSIPVSRGLGSSAALIAAGAAAANVLGSLGMPREELLALCTRMEGHPDNLAPALFGGFTASTCEDGKVVTVRFPLHPSLCFLAVIPDFELSTALARQALPETVSRGDAVFQLSRTALLLRAFEEGDMELLRFAMRDRLHQPFRLPLIPGAGEVFAEAGKAGAAACISGAGSTILIVSDGRERLDTVRRALTARFPKWKILSPEADTEGLRIT